MSKGKKRRVSIRIDMTPMVDIAFLLLIFYMATTQFKPPEARAVELPESHSQIELPEKDVIFITVTRYDSIYVDFVEIAKIEMEGQEVTTTVRRVRSVDRFTAASVINDVRAKNSRALVVVKADKEATFGAMQGLMKTMQENFLERFLIITEKESDDAS